MASSKANQKKTKKACDALKHLGISAKGVRLTLKRLLEAYENNWTYIEEENYRVLIDAVFELEEPMVLDKPILRFDNEEPDFNLCDEPDDEEIEPLRKKPRTQNRPSSPAGSSIPCASEMQHMVEHDFGAVDILERHKPKLRIEKVQHDFNLFGDSDEEENEAQSQDRPSFPAGSSVPCSSNYESEMHKNMDDKGNEFEDEDKIVTPCLSQIDLVSSSSGEVKLALSICKPSLGFRIPSLDAVMKLVEEKYRENFQGLGVEFILSELLKEVCECFVEQGNMSDGNNQSLVQTFENFMEAEKQCGQLNLSNAPSDHTDAPVPIPRYVVSSPFTNVHVVNGVFSDVFNRTFRKQNTPVINNLSDSTSLTLCLKDDSLQRGIQANLQVFMTAEGKGWGLRTLEDLLKGTFICKYVGEIVSNPELFEQNEQNTDEKHTNPVLLDEGFLKDEQSLCLDAMSLGNVARFINHRCEDANLVAVEVESPDHQYYHDVFFTARDVKAMEELTWVSNHVRWSDKQTS
uniref:Probable inactive histone-lysine N-methyltransferase SUVR2 n=1 Tax=Tanacetum cinerariifolium TaxID=118510 RepID=A0A6L2M6Z4_TANCI|nr:probable inactive histone-lysine N-methyltransferase SUVR2 [Tanacetum cinerariifolium]